MSSDIRKLVDDIRNTSDAKTVYVNVLFYDLNLKRDTFFNLNKDVYQKCLTEFSTNRTINGVPLYVVADKRHPPYMIV